MTCTEFLGKLSDYFDERLDPELLSEVKAHVKKCSHCEVVLDSTRKTISIYKELEKEDVPAEKFANIHAPVGLEIGAVTPEEIAVAIVAEMIAERRHATPNVASKMYSYPPGREEQDAIEEETTRNS